MPVTQLSPVTDAEPKRFDNEKPAEDPKISIEEHAGDLGQRPHTILAAPDAESLVLDDNTEPRVLSSSPEPIDLGNGPRLSMEQYLHSEKKIEDQSPSRRKNKKKRHIRSTCLRLLTSFGNNLLAYRNPIAIIIGQVLILAFAWSFFRFVFVRTVVPLSPSMAARVQINPHITTLVVTLIATAISAVSSLLLSLSIQYAINYYLLCRSLSVYTLGSSIMILNGAPIIDPRHLVWSFIGLSMLLATGTQTAR
ncbi:hypothetical protein GALMADRAFT_1180829 [Galerina marginata CBS 339.88]|uniref:Uncharacterized protein n=1 Tax=Galerina marginata (strain CBS 339.88) TaxID=685588 RepID=A0A067TAF7_GALM3|nr:hypothetical protein GALMADRAFT_1180829 [Galerina marginata CBS 339.88]